MSAPTRGRPKPWVRSSPARLAVAYRIEGKKRFAEIPKVLHMSVAPLPTAHPSGEMWAASGHPVSPDKLAFAVGEPGSTFSDHDMRWDNSGKNGHYAPIRWSGP
jgi:hypothetical protein